MIVFKNGELEGGEISFLMHIDSDETADYETLLDYPLRENVAILIIPKDDKSIQIIDARSEGITYIPYQDEDASPFHHLFWDSAETYVCVNFESVLQLMKYYDGRYKKKIETHLIEIQEHMIECDVRENFQSTFEINKMANPDFLHDLNQFVSEQEISMDTVLANMKIYMLDFYKKELRKLSIYS